MRIAVRNFQTRPILDAAALRRLVEAALAATGEAAAAVGFAFVDDAGMIEHQRRFAGRDRPTDVLAFPAAATPEGGWELGDVVVCTDRARLQARQLGHGYLQELGILALHGVLHLLGYEHGRRQGRMRWLEERLRPRLLGEVARGR